jgi:regulatory protein
MDRFEKYLNLTYRYLSIRNRSVKEIRDYLTKKKAEPEVIERMIALLSEQKFLNDENFARAWVLSRARFRPRGKQLLKIELQQKGIAKDIIEKILSEEQEDVPDELTQATRLIERRIEKLQDAPRQEVYQKVGSFLARRGFSWGITKKAIDTYLEKRVADDIPSEV